MSQGKSLHSWNSGRRITFSRPPRREIAGAQPSLVVCKVRLRGLVATRSTSWERASTCGASAAACFLPSGVRGASWTVVGVEHQ